MNKINLENRVAIVTGGAQGFGLAITKRFIKSGCKVAIWDKEKQLHEEIEATNEKDYMIFHLKIKFVLRTLQESCWR